VSASLEQYHDTGLLSLAAGVAADNVNPALRAMLGELRELRAGLPPDEVERIKDYLAGRWLCAEGTDFHASFAGRDEQVFGSPTTVDEEIRRLRAVDLDLLRALAQELFTPERLFLSVVGPYRHTAALDRLLGDL
jgi:predicted Zn-dependent peptidase